MSMPPIPKTLISKVKPPDFQTSLTFLTYWLIISGVLLIAQVYIRTYFTEQHFVHLADSFLQGRLYFTEEPSATGWADTSLYKGKHYWPLGMFPAILILPFVALFGTGFAHGYVSLPLTLITMFLLYKIAIKITKKKPAAMLLSFAYVFSTAYIYVALAPFSWYFAHVVASFCLISAIYFTIVKPRPFLAGMFFSFAFLTRISTVLGIPFFLLYYLLFKKDRLPVKQMVLFIIPVILGLLIFFTYNYARFENAVETGYRYQLLPSDLMANKEVGMWSIRHFPMHIFLLFLKTPDVIFYEGTKVVQKLAPNPWGMSFLYTSPIFLYLGFVNLRNRLNLIALTAALFISLFLFGSFGIGYMQYGYRFALDFQPFLFIMLATVFRERGFGVLPAIIICFSFFLNILLIYNASATG
jgi:hypothetical protein